MISVAVVREVLKNWTTLHAFLKQTGTHSIYELKQLERYERKHQRRKSFIKRIVRRRFMMMMKLELECIDKEFENENQ